MGTLLECRDVAGLPEALLLPIEPKGKKPAIYDVVSHNWRNLPGWQKADLEWEGKIPSDEAGCNVGLLLGVPGKVGDRDVSFAAIDIDLNEGEEECRGAILKSFVQAWGDHIIPVRLTVPWRFMILVRFKDPFSTGRKMVFKLSFADKEIGKIELLTTGQQAVIAGIHASGKQILWRMQGNGMDLSPIPHLPPNMPEFSDANELMTELREHIKKLTDFGFAYDVEIGGGLGENVPDADLVPQWLTVETLIEFIRKTPNDNTVSRESYVSFMEAVAACRWGLECRLGPLSTTQSTSLLDALTGWAVRWPGHINKVQATITERGKIESDWFSRRGGFRTSWSRLVGLSQELGYTEAVTTAAQNEFPVDQTIKRPKTVEEPDDLPSSLQNQRSKREQPTTEESERDRIDPHRPGVRMDYIEHADQSDKTLADVIGNETPFNLNQQLAYMPEDRRWLIWTGKGWERDTDKDSEVNRRVMNALHTYVATYGQAWTKGEKNHVLSANKVRSVLFMLGVALYKEPGQVTPSTYCLQTPAGSFDMRNGGKLTNREVKRRFDYRYTRVSPDFSDKATPWFDMLLDGLAESDADVIEWVWHYLGYCALGDPTADCFLVIWGPGGNGKSRFFQVLDYIFGDYHVPLDARCLLESGQKLHDTSLWQLKNKRLALTSELSAKEKWNEPMLKRITGGDEINARDMRESASQFRCEAGLIVMCNELPAFNRVTPALLRRFRMIGTMRQPTKPDTALFQKIRDEEASLILGKIMRYAMKVWNPEGGVYDHVKLPDAPAAMVTAATGFLTENDPFYAWISAECVIGVAGETEVLDDLKKRCDAFIARAAKEKGGMPGEVMTDKAFRDALRVVAVRTFDENGKPFIKEVTVGLARRRVHMAKGIRFKVKEAEVA